MCISEEEKCKEARHWMGAYSVLLDRIGQRDDRIQELMAENIRLKYELEHLEPIVDIRT